MPLAQKTEKSQKNNGQEYKVVTTFPVLIKGITPNIDHMELYRDKIILYYKDGKTFKYWIIHNERVWESKKNNYQSARLFYEELKKYFIRNGKYIIIYPPRLPEYIKVIESLDKYIRARSSNQNEIQNFFDIKFILSLTMGEIVGKQKMEKEAMINIWYALSSFPWNALPSFDEANSIGAFQMRESTYNSIAKLFKNELPPYFHNCVSFYCQAKAALLLNYHELGIVGKYVMSKPYFKEIWGKSPDEEKKKFVSILVSSLHNLGMPIFMSLFNKFIAHHENKRVTADLKQMNEELLLFLDLNTPYKTGSYARANFELYKLLSAKLNKI